MYILQNNTILRILEGTALYARFLLAPAEEFGGGLFYPSDSKNFTDFFDIIQFFLSKLTCFLLIITHTCNLFSNE